jgi:hypothetical protein
MIGGNTPGWVSRLSLSGTFDTMHRSSQMA